MEKNEVLHMRIDPELKSALVKAAKRDGRSASGLVVKLIQDHLERVDLHPDAWQGSGRLQKCG